jgi:hypothetical protein
MADEEANDLILLQQIRQTSHFVPFLGCADDNLREMSNNVEFCPRIPFRLASFPKFLRLAID